MNRRNFTTKRPGPETDWEEPINFKYLKWVIITASFAIFGLYLVYKRFCASPTPYNAYLAAEAVRYRMERDIELANRRQQTTSTMHEERQ